MSIDVCLDVTRLRARLRHETPTGIDRVDLAYLRAFAAAPDLRLHLVAHGPLGPERLRPAAACRLIDSLDRDWQQREQGRAPARYAALRAWLESPPPTPGPRLPDMPRAGLRAGIDRWLDGARSAADQGRERLARRRGAGEPALPRGTVYVHTSHGQLYRESYGRWLRETGLRGLFFVHDLIPIRHPEYSRAQEPARHATRLRRIAAHAGAVIVNSAATAADLAAYWRAQGVAGPPIDVAPLGVTPPTAVAPVPRASRPYFVMLGTLEPRKNHLLLLRLWQQLVAEQGEKAPRLVLAGRRGWENQTVFSLLDRGLGLSRHVIECPGLGDAELAGLLRGARALLNPSFAEGYGLPVAEALALGVPVLASDLAAHREVAYTGAEFLDPLDGPAWHEAITDYARARAPRRSAALKAARAYRPPHWAGHFALVLARIRRLHVL